MQNVNNSMQTSREILRMVTIEIVINSAISKLTLYPAGMHCRLGQDDVLVSSLFLSRSESALCVRFEQLLCHGL